jgi:hypothetical protein
MVERSPQPEAAWRHQNLLTSAMADGGMSGGCAKPCGTAIFQRQLHVPEYRIDLLLTFRLAYGLQLRMIDVRRE